MKDNKAKKVASSSVYRTVIGGVVGATIGYLSNPKTGKRIMSRIESTDLKQKSKNLGKTTMEKISNIKDYGAERSQQTAKKLKNKTAGLLKKEKSEDQENQSTSSEEQDLQEVNAQDNNEEQAHQAVNAKDNNDEQFQILEYENRKLNERLKLIEKKLEQLAPLSEEEKNDEDVIVDRDEKDEQRPLKVSSKNKRIKNDKKPKEFTISSNDDTSSK